jgi:hypothetical protein
MEMETIWAENFWPFIWFFRSNIQRAINVSRKWIRLSDNFKFIKTQKIFFFLIYGYLLTLFSNYKLMKTTIILCRHNNSIDNSILPTYNYYIWYIFCILLIGGKKLATDKFCSLRSFSIWAAQNVLRPNKKII